MTPVRSPRGLLFDLDGTLIDAAPDIAAALAEVLTTLGREPIAEPVVRRMVGHGIARLVADALAATGGALDGAALDHAVALMADAYAARLTDRTVALPGAAALLADCAARGIALACVTNKPGAMAETILRHLGLMPPITLVIGGDSRMPRKPAPEPLLAAVAALGLHPQDVWMVGDGLPDMAAATAAGIVRIAVPSDYGERFDPADHGACACADLSALHGLIARLGAEAA